MQNRSAQTHQRILDAALAVFAQSGYEASSVADICAAAGVSKGAFFHHFPTKQAIFLELLEVWLAALDASMETARGETNTVPQAIMQMTGLMSSVSQSASNYLPVFLEFWTQASHDPAVWQAVIAPYHRYQAYFAGLIQEGVAEGSFKPVNPDLSARTIVGLAVGLLLQGVLDPGATDWAQETQHSMQMLIDSFMEVES